MGLIVGASGWGKTSLLNCLVGAVEPRDGRISYSKAQPNFIAFPQTAMVLEGSFFHNCDISHDLSKSKDILPVLKELFAPWALETIERSRRHISKNRKMRAGGR